MYLRDDMPVAQSGGADRSEEMTDETLFERVADGDARAYRTLVDRHAAPQVRYARRFLGNVDDAQEVVQEAFLRVWREAGRWRPGQAKFTTWLYKVVTNLCIDRKRRWRVLFTDDPPEEMDTAPQADGQMMAAEQAATLQLCMDDLAPRQRSAILLCYFEELSNREAADVMGLTVEALESLLTRGRQRMRQMLATHGIEKTDWYNESQETHQHS
jgi:RNA polymerase sigma-70 factor (ECF subfamily)